MGRNKTDKSDRNKETKESERGKENSKISIFFESMDPKRKIKRSFNKNLNSRIRMFGSEDPLSPSSSSLKRRSKTMKTTVERDETKGIKRFGEGEKENGGRGEKWGRIGGTGGGESRRGERLKRTGEEVKKKRGREIKAGPQKGEYKKKKKKIRLRASVSVGLGLSSNELPTIDYDTFFPFVLAKQPVTIHEQITRIYISHAPSLTEFTPFLPDKKKKKKRKEIYVYLDLS